MVGKKNYSALSRRLFFTVHRCLVWVENSDKSTHHRVEFVVDYKYTDPQNLTINLQFELPPSQAQF